MDCKNLVSSDLPKGTLLLNELISHISSVGNTILTLNEKLQNKELSNTSGLSLLELKNQAFASYLSHLSLTSLFKLSGKKLEGSESIKNLVELRVLLERIKPIENKAKFQINNYLTETSKKTKDNSAKMSINDIGNSSSENEDDDDEEEQEADGSTKASSKVYKAPKISQVHYPEDDEKKEKEAAKIARQRKRLLNSDMMRDALEEFTEDPEVIHNNAENLKTKVIDEHKDIIRYEEEHFTRLSLPKKTKRSFNSITTPGLLAKELLSFRSLDGKGPSRGGKKRKMSMKSKGKKHKRSK